MYGFGRKDERQPALVRCSGEKARLGLLHPSEQRSTWLGLAGLGDRDRPVQVQRERERKRERSVRVAIAPRKKCKEKSLSA